MQTLRLNNGIRIPSIGFGTYKIKDLTEILPEAMHSGYRLIDSAICYRNESSIGDYFSSTKFKSLGIEREELFITTKIPPNFQGTDNCKEAVLESLKRFQMDYIDLVLIHWPGAAKLKPDSAEHRSLRQQTYEQLERFQEIGLIRSIGVSNYGERHLQDLLEHCTIKPVINQIELHPYLRQQELQQFCADNDILVQAYSPLGSSNGVQQLCNDATIREITLQTGRTFAQVLIRWSLQNGCCVLPKTQQLTRIKENIRVFDFQLTDDQMCRLNRLNRNLHFCWDSNAIL